MPSLGELARLVNGEVIGDETTEIIGVTGLDAVKPGMITFADNSRVLEKILDSEASAIIIPTGIVTSLNKPVILVANPRLAFTQLLNYFLPPKVCQPGIHPSAIIGENFIGKECSIGALVCVGNNVVIGKGCLIMTGVVIEDRVRIGEGSIIHPNVVIYADCVIGNKVEIHSGTIIGADGFGYVTIDSKHFKIPQVGKVIIEDDVEIGANVTVDRATSNATIIKRGTKIDNLVQVAHNCQIGQDNLLIAQVGIAGSTKLGDRVTMAGKSSVVGHMEIEADTVVAAHALVNNSLPTKSFVAGVPARPFNEEMRIKAATARLPELLKEIRELRKKVRDLEERILS